jgi:two-component system CheB/CheR fusion protein
MDTEKKRSAPHGADAPDRKQVSHYVGIGASAGGLEAIETLFRNMPAESGMAFIVIQHLSPDYKSLMVELLSKKTAMNVLRAEDGMTVEPDHVYLIPPKKNLRIFHGRLLLQDQPHGQGINLPIDIFLRSLAEDQAERAVGIVLSGTGSDGTRGVRAIKEFNGLVIVQDEASARFDGMPRAAASTGLADFILPPEKIPGQLLAYAKHPYESTRGKQRQMLENADGLTRIFAELRDKTKVDFTFYKQTTIARRVERRITVCQSRDIDEYVRYLQQYPGEVMALYRELLIGVTSFFRDPEAWDALAEAYLPRLLKQSGNREVRFWVAGCSTGEEAYSLAITTREAMETLGVSRDVKIFATDIGREAIMAAGTGVYPESIAADLNPRLLGKYFYRKGDNYQIARHIREMVVFAQHNLIKDPPFTNIDLVSCRNLLIYLQPVLQQKALQMFNFSLHAQGILFLGTSETVGEMMDYFTPLHQKAKLYESKGRNQPLENARVPRSSGEARRLVSRDGGMSRRFSSRDENRIENRFLEVVAQEFVPLGVVVNEQMEILYTLGNTEGFFKVPAGRAVYDISKMASRDLSIPLSTGIQKVFRTGEPITYTNINLRYMDQARSVKMRIVPIPEHKGQESLVAVFLEVVHQQQTRDSSAGEDTYDIGEDARQRIKDLDLELQFTKENLQATIEELETSNEELQATNEELLASNEELQSTNEELQSTNEELYTVNAEYQNKINELTELNNDVDNLLTSSRIGKLLLDEDLQIRRFSPEIGKIFLIMEKDIGRPLTHLAHKLVDFDPIAAIRTVQAENQVLEKDVQTRNGTTYLMRILPYTIGPKTFSGVVLAFIDITDLKTTERSLTDSRRKSDDIIQHMPAGLFLYRLNEQQDLILEHSNPEAEQLTGVRTDEWAGKSFDAIWPNARKNGITQKFLDVMSSGKTCYLEDVRYEDERLEGAYRIQAFKLPGNRLAVSFEDITRQVRMQRELEASEQKYRTLFETMAQGVVYQTAGGEIVAANPAAEKILGLSLDQMRGRTSLDPRWKATREDGSELPGDQHPAMVALRTGKPVTGFIMGVFNPVLEQKRWILVNATPEFKPGEDTPYQAYATFDDVTNRIKAQPE